MADHQDNKEEKGKEAGSYAEDGHESEGGVPRVVIGTGPGARIFLVVADNTEEVMVALRFACQRSVHTDGSVALLNVREHQDFHHWLGVGTLMAREEMDNARNRMEELAQIVEELTGHKPTQFYREGTPARELLALLDEEPGISVLVLGACTHGDGPGPIISHLTGRGRNNLRVPLIIVPGNMTDAQIDAIT